MIIQTIEKRMPPRAAVLRPPSPVPAMIFFIRKNKKYFTCNAKKIFIRTCRIIFFPRPAMGALLAVFFLSSAFFSSQAWPEAQIPPDEVIVCPEAHAGQEESSLDEYDLARAYDKGYCGIASNQKTAEDWYLKAAGHGHMLAQYHLGEIYFSGVNGSPDYSQAKKWYLAAAEQGYGLAQLRLGFLYAEGHFKGLSVDYAEAEKWFLKAAEQNAGDAQFRLGNFYHNYKNPPDLKNAVLWLTRAAEGGHRVAMFDLSRMLKNGDGCQKNPAQALAWMQKAAALDLLPAQMTLSEMYAAGDGVPKDPQQSLIWTLKIATEPTAAPFWIDRAADIFFDGWEGIPKNYLQAMALYKRAASKDDPHAFARLGLMYMKGLSVPVNKTRARIYLEKASAKGDKEAETLLKGLRP